MNMFGDIKIINLTITKPLPHSQSLSHTHVHAQEGGWKQGREKNIPWDVDYFPIPREY